MRGWTVWAAVAAMVWTLSMGVAQAATPDWYRAAFLALSEDARMVVQDELAEVELYVGPRDGAWSPAMEKALMGTPAYLREHSVDGVQPILDNEADTARFLREMSEGLWGPYLYGGAGENGDHTEF